MIKVNFVEPTTPEWIQWKKDAKEAREEAIKKVKAGEKPEIDAALYKKMKDIIFDAFHGKCAYCESPIAATLTGKGDVEHFRPKGRVMDENGKPVMVELPNGKKIPHPGYYWLAYDWHNLLPACNKCNRPEKNKTDGKLIGKWDRFPVDGFRAYQPGDEVKEKSLFIHPFFDNPEEHFTFDEATGIIGGKTDAGKTCIEMLGLNRESLPEDRRTTYTQVKSFVDSATACAIHNSFNDLANYLKQLKAYSNGEKYFSMAGRKAIADLKQSLKPIFDLISSLSQP